jgi:hypothetical protein
MYATKEEVDEFMTGFLKPATRMFKDFKDMKEPPEITFKIMKADDFYGSMAEKMLDHQKPFAPERGNG